MTAVSLLTWLKLFDLPHSGPGQHRALGPAPLVVADVVDGGVGRINGTVKVAGTPPAPVRRRVRLFDRRAGRLVRETWSDSATGAYEFADLAIGREFTVVAYDHTGTHNAVIADPLEAEPMP